ncbi:MAG: TolC family protein [Acidobacteria bacterium]|nr:MAG: TolC family protein [Acidobacteriota bacterium]
MKAPWSLILLAALGPLAALAQTPEQAGRALALSDLERMAEANNPTLKQAQARIAAARGKLAQAGLYPNPVLGYMASEVSGGPVIRGGEHGFFVEQRIVLGGKLARGREASAQALAGAEAEAEGERLRVLNTVRLLYYQALAARRRVEVREQLAGVADEAVRTSRALYNVGASDRPDNLEIEIEAEQARLAEAAARNDELRIRQELAAAVGALDLGPGRLAGELEDGIPTLEADRMLEQILRESPSLKAARAGAAEARAEVEVARSRKVPDLILRGGVRYNRELLEAGRPVGAEGFADVGMVIPIFDRNQGNVAAALAGRSFAEEEVRRVELRVRARFAAWFERYKTARLIAERYRQEILPRAQAAYELYAARYREMAAAYPQVLIARRTLFQSSIDYVAALENLWRAVVPLQGYLLLEGEGSGASRQFIGDDR